jgi:BirA family biotin operon repressor/biotin-[acetyl-CoA-carboxylase] ligase
VRDVAREHGADAWVKWPNDVFIGKAKLAGVLCELTDPGGVPGIIIGIGLNLRVDALPSELRDRAAGLETDERAVDRDRLVVGLAERLVHYEGELEAGRWGDVRASCLEAMSPMIGAEVFLGPGGEPRRVRGLDEHGALLVEAPGGVMESFLAGDVRLGTEAACCW